MLREMRFHFDERNRFLFLFTSKSFIIEFEGMDRGHVRDMLNCLYTTEPVRNEISSDTNFTLQITLLSPQGDLIRNK